MILVAQDDTLTKGTADCAVERIRIWQWPLVNLIVVIEPFLIITRDSNEIQ
jgi:hypothetical protein